MLIWIAAAMVLGVALGFLFPLSVPTAWSLYLTMGLLAAVDSLLGALHAYLYDQFQTHRFLVGVGGNFFLALFLLYLGKRLGLDLTLAISVVFVLRIFNNFSRIIQHVLQSHHKKGRIETIAQDVAFDPEDGGSADGIN